LERRKAKNAEMRIKYAEDPQKFMESEVELNTAIQVFYNLKKNHAKNPLPFLINQFYQEMHVITTKPQFYHILVEHGTVQTLLQLVGHDNADIIAAVCNLLQVLIIQSYIKIFL
jgi:beta-catenin-like protein 1